MSTGRFHAFICIISRTSKTEKVRDTEAPTRYAKGLPRCISRGRFFFFLMTVYYLMKNERISHLQGSL